MLFFEKNERKKRKECTLYAFWQSLFGIFLELDAVFVFKDFHRPLHFGGFLFCIPV